MPQLRKRKRRNAATALLGGCTGENSRSGTEVIDLYRYEDGGALTDAVLDSLATETRVIELVADGDLTMDGGCAQQTALLAARRQGPRGTPSQSLGKGKPNHSQVVQTRSDLSQLHTSWA